MSIERIVRKLIGKPLTELQIAARHIHNADDHTLGMVALQYHLEAMLNPDFVGKNGIPLSEMLRMIDSELARRRSRRAA